MVRSMVALWLMVFGFFFFQAEDGIRDVAVTGVQTCALPISAPPVFPHEMGTNALSGPPGAVARLARSEEHTSELQSRLHLVCRLLLEKKNQRRDAAELGVHADHEVRGPPSNGGAGGRTSGGH